MTTAQAHGAMLLLFDIPDDARAEHDHWHTHEHMRERLALPGFVRGSRWVAAEGSPGYCVLYEVAELAVLDSAAYRARLDAPTPWTAKMMERYVGMRRTLCEVVATAGVGRGGSALVTTFDEVADRAAEAQRWLANLVLPELAGRAGIATAQLLRHALDAAMTREQAIRGRDASVACALVVTGYDQRSLASLRDRDLAPAVFAARGATVSGAQVFRLAYELRAGENARGSAEPTP